VSSAHRSIGEVLESLQGDFPDVTVSKIRFLESQGLIAPERTPSGYRKFYEPDVARLRWILTQQRDHFLPLKVIKSRLAQLEEQAVGAVEGVEGDGSTPAESTPNVPPPGDVAVPSVAEAAIPDVSDEAEVGESGTQGVATGASLSRAELARATGLDERVLAELEGFGLLPPPRVHGEEAVYDEEALVVARLARGFLRHGVEARHLRMYRTFAEREAAFVGQLVTPILRQKNPEARQNARETVAELARLGGGMRAAMLRVALRDALGE